MLNKLHQGLVAADGMPQLIPMRRASRHLNSNAYEVSYLTGVPNDWWCTRVAFVTSRASSTDWTSLTVSVNRPFPSCCESHYESEAKCKTFHMKISFVYI